jgi:hypothetical protein
MDKSNKIECSVINCKYHTDDIHCSASAIQVSPTEDKARTASETGCMTFKSQK